MKSCFRIGLVAVLLISLAGAFPAGYGPRLASEGYPKPLTFEWRGRETVGQPFAARISGHEFRFGLSGTVWEVIGATQELEPVLQFAGTRSNVRPRADGPAAGVANYFVGSRPERWRTNVPLFKKIKYTGLYPGIDLIYYGSQNRLEYDLVVAPGASWQSIRLAFDRRDTVEIDSGGDLSLRTGWGWITHTRPTFYQRAGAGRRQVSGRYVLRSENEVGFEIDHYDSRLPLIIDPTLAYASYLGGSGDDYGHAVAVDSSGCAYVVGETGSANFPTVGAEQALIAGNSDLFVTKWNAAGTGLVYATYIGGNSRDVGLGVALDGAGNAYVTGYTYSSNFPVTAGALRSVFTGNSKAFILKLNATGSTLVYSTLLGGSGDDHGAGIAVDSAGEAHVAGYTASIDFPTTTAAFQPYYGGGPSDGFFAKLNAAGSALIYATYLGGRANDTAAGVALDPSGNIYVTGQTQSANFPTFNPLQAANNESDAFVVKMNASGRVVYATYLGGTGLNNGTGIAADAAGNAYITGFTSAPDFPVTANAYQVANNGVYSGFIATINTYGSSILNATYLGGSGSDASFAIALDGSGNVFIAGSTYSIDFPAKAAIQAAYSGGGDAFVAGFNNQLTSLLYATYFGGSGNDAAASIALDSPGNAYITGWTSSAAPAFPITPGAFQPVFMGGIDAFLAELSFNGTSLACSTSAPQVPNVQAGRSSQLVGDVILNCTGGTAGAQVTASIQATLNANIANTNPAEMLVGSNAQPAWGTVSGESSVLFQGVSFVAPGPSATTILRITNIWSDTSSLAVGGQVVMMLTLAPGSSITVTPAQQTVAVVQNLVPPGFEPASGITLSGSSATFSWMVVSGATQYQLSVSTTPGGTDIFNGAVMGTSKTINFIPCTGGTIYVQWAAEVNGFLQPATTYSYSCRSAIGDFNGDGHQDLLWQSTSSGQVNVNYYGGAGPQPQGFAVLDNGAGPAGWKLVGAGDFDHNGTPDLVYQNTTSGQVNVNYYSGTTVIGSACLSCGINTTQWKLVAVADFDSNGTPDLVYQNTVTHQVNVNYYGGPGGTTLIGCACLSCGLNLTNWQVVAAADFDGNGTPDLVYQNTVTHQVNVDYYGGTGGATLISFACLSCGINTTGWQVVGAADWNADGVPDLVYQNTQTGQVNVDYYGGGGGAVLKSYNCLNCGSIPVNSLVRAVGKFGSSGEQALVYQSTTNNAVTAYFYAFGGAVFESSACVSCGIDTTSWKLVGTGDFDGNGTPDLVYQNVQTHQVNVDYYSGTSFIGYACLSCGLNLTDWEVVAVADFNGDGVPDLVYQNTATHQVNVDYYGGNGGATLKGYACLSCGINTTDWQVKGAADFDGNGVPDLVYQNAQTGQVNVSYYGGASGATFMGAACLTSGNNTAGWQVMGAGDFDGNGVPDLVFQNTQTGQVNVYYYGGAGGAVLQGSNVLSSTGNPGWSVIVPRSR